MEVKFKVLLLNKPSTQSYAIPYFWASAKSYYEENSQKSENWEWALPFFDYLDLDTIVDNIVKINPTVVGFSVYVWNEKLFNQIAQRLKEINPKIIIVFGGPQCDIKSNENYFLEKPYVDSVSSGDAYGEIIWKEILDSIVVNNGKLDVNDIPYSYYPGTDNSVKFNDRPIDKKGFKWPQNVFAAQETELATFLKNIQKPIWSLLETSRGCPYKCSFCDWGGGIYTKTNKKDFNIVLDEIDWIAKNQIDGIYITDANYGLFDTDIEYTRHIVRAREKYGYPKRVVIQPTKSKLKNLFLIYKMLSEADLIFHYKVAVEDINEEVLKNIDRVDFSFEDKMKMCKELQKNKNLPILVEGIMGLPGSSINIMIDNIHQIVSNGLNYPLNHIWMLLPETPAYAKEYREKFKLITVKNKNHSTGIFPLLLKDNAKADPGVMYDVNDEQTTCEMVVGTISYSRDEWIMMNLLQNFVCATFNTNILTLISKYMSEFHNMKYGEFYYWVLTQLLANDSTNYELIKIKQASEDWVYGDAKTIHCDYDSEFPYKIFPLNYLIFGILSNASVFFENIFQLLFEKTNDEKLYDLCHYSKNRLITLDYSVGQKFQVEYDWESYEKTGVLTKRKINYTVTDTTVSVGGTTHDIDWDLYPDNRLVHFFYRTCYDAKDSKLAKNLIAC